MSACSVILAINIYEKDQDKNFESCFFRFCNVTKEGLIDLNTKIWNNE